MIVFSFHQMRCPAQFPPVSTPEENELMLQASVLLCRRVCLLAHFVAGCFASQEQCSVAQGSLAFPPRFEACSLDALSLADVRSGLRLLEEASKQSRARAQGSLRKVDPVKGNKMPTLAIIPRCHSGKSKELTRSIYVEAPFIRRANVGPA